VTVSRKRQRLFKASRKEQPAEPETLMAQHLRASMMRWDDERQRLYAELKRTGSVDANSVTTAAFEVGVRRRFRPGVDLREISSFIADIRAAFGDNVPVMETEALIRHALGEDVPVDDLLIQMEIGAKVLTLVAIKDVLSLDEAGVNAILVEAEALARQRGFEPTIADR